MKLEKNVGKTDMMVRLVLGVAAFAAGFLYLSEPLNYVAYLLGVIWLVTGASRTCPAYSLVGVNTAEKAAPKK